MIVLSISIPILIGLIFFLNYSSINKIFIEISGGITLKTISKFNIPGVSGISVGAITHQSRSVDIGLDVK